MSDEAEVARLMADPWWRLKYLFHIKSEETGQIIPFRPYPEQMEVFNAVLHDRHHSIIIPKARRRGMSTAIEVLGTDLCMTNAGFEMGIVDRTATDATKKMKNICEISLDKLPDFIKNDINRGKSNDDHLSFSVGDKRDEDAESHIYASTGYRGGNCNFLHVSEWGWVQCEDPKRSEEIQTGAIQAARKGIKIIETTWKGGKRGHLWDYTKLALETPEEEKHPRSWRVMFFPWHTDPFYHVDSLAKIRTECEDYFRELEFVHGIRLTIGQKRWYQEEAWPLGNNRFGEYPSHLEECFMSPMEGVIYDKEMSRVLAEKRITTIPVEPGIPVFVSIDIGKNDAMPLTFLQPVGKEIRVVNYYVTHNELIPHYAQVIKEWCRDKKVDIGDIYICLPHDGGRESLETGNTLADAFRNCGFTHVQTVSVIGRVWSGIQHVRDTFPYLYFDKKALNKTHERGKQKFPSLGECLGNYHQAEMLVGKRMSMEPVHDIYCHGCDSIRTFCEGWQRGIFGKQASRGSEGFDDTDTNVDSKMAGTWR